MFVVLWASPDQSICTRDDMPETVHRHCHHCRPSPRRPSCAACCPRSSSPAVGVAVCQTPPASPNVTYSTLPPSPRTTTTVVPSRPTSPCCLGESHADSSWSRASSVASTRLLDSAVFSERPRASLSHGHATLCCLGPSTMALCDQAATTCAKFSLHLSHSIAHQAVLSRSSCVPSSRCCDAQGHALSAAEFRCRRGLTEVCPGFPSSGPVLLSQSRL
ncbi:hypothetical protein CC85DRAFT_5332 [Cutaneotrichosporon oleaginosum]|uniref:Uncharacterized protein n=1 Tax=Cutaneotrichosporon oleaginosum TaxID=879819 RepID=A0A0J1BEJ5_9TREE|nr:uncharacterized protein CC85DRAFT_5332 [Cutaneotrichosporon oleaginosum]KLT46544.1 hypothetical protein CC85DRAFT_5332 [Cutaneotrichosporon oleaginosum]TXT15089.1 hypothetical protein COLE_01282 [Cutaneotrichosporon oleaginosum]